MLSVFLVAGLALVLAAVSSLVRDSSRPPSPAELLSSPALAGATSDATDQLVLVVGPALEDVVQVGSNFRKLYQDGGLEAFPFQVHALEPGVTALTFPQHLPAVFFYFLINYLSYPEPGYSGAAHVRGWATLPIVTRERVVSPPEPVLVCGPPDDTAPDAVLLLTPTAVYQVSFRNLLPIPLRYAVPVAYTAPPYPLAAVQQLPATELR